MKLLSVFAFKQTAEIHVEVATVKVTIAEIHVEVATIKVTIVWRFTTFYFKFDSPQVKRQMIHV